MYYKCDIYIYIYIYYIYIYIYIYILYIYIYIYIYIFGSYRTGVTLISSYDPGLDIQLSFLKRF